MEPASDRIKKKGYSNIAWHLAAVMMRRHGICRLTILLRPIEIYCQMLIAAVTVSSKREQYRVSNNLSQQNFLKVLYQTYNYYRNKMKRKWGIQKKFHWNPLATSILTRITPSDMIDLTGCINWSRKVIRCCYKMIIGTPMEVEQAY